MKEVDAELEVAQMACARDADRHIHIVTTKDSLEEAEHELRQLNDRLKTEFLGSISSKAETLSRSVVRGDEVACFRRFLTRRVSCFCCRIKIYRDVCRAALERRFPGWIKKLQYAYR